ncbi:hypothetical protein [Ensifer sp. NM-2]|uniref:hypothetical protein n=1 Tax=Ensifer sp. NM-2 TaxID=2109730 RepID=UPI001AEC8638|nr:hypothetical protein [Ensifer sp. NM-2]
MSSHLHLSFNMASLTTTSTPVRSKRGDMFEAEDDDQGDLSVPAAPRKSKRRRLPPISTAVAGVVEASDPLLCSQFPENLYASQIVPATPICVSPPRIETVSNTADEPSRIDRFLDTYERRTEPPAKFLVKLKYFPENIITLKEFGLDGNFHGSAHRLHVTWKQFAKLTKLKLISHVEQFPQNFWEVIEKAEKDAEDRET